MLWSVETALMHLRALPEPYMNDDDFGHPMCGASSERMFFVAVSFAAVVSSVLHF